MRQRSAFGSVALGLLLAALAALWRFPPLEAVADVEGALDWGNQVAEMGAFGSLLTIAIFVIASCLMFPISAMIAVTAVVMEPFQGFATTLIGALAAAGLFWFARIGSGRWMHLFGSGMVSRGSRRLAAKEKFAVVVLRVVPFAPSTLVNLVAGASHLRFKDYLLGTVIGMTPGVLALSLFGSQVERALHDPEPRSLALAAAFGLLVVGLGWIGQRTIGDRTKEKDGETQA